jgi:hypothetical protein
MRRYIGLGILGRRRSALATPPAAEEVTLTELTA